jgi:hypothetical protein
MDLERLGVRSFHIAEADLGCCLGPDICDELVEGIPCFPHLDNPEPLISRVANVDDEANVGVADQFFDGRMSGVIHLNGSGHVILQVVGHLISPVRT